MQFENYCVLELIRKKWSTKFCVSGVLLLKEKLLCDLWAELAIVAVFANGVVEVVDIVGDSPSGLGFGGEACSQEHVLFE